MTVRKLIMIGTAGVLSTLACASQTAAINGGGPGGGPRIALRRGGAVSTYSVQPPAILGSTAQLRLEGQTLRGFVGSGSLQVKIDNDSASGFGPSGSIDVRIQQQAGALIVDGLWNGGPVHVIFGATWLKGTIVRWGANVIRPATCGYDLDHLDQGGSFVGTSICEGMPERTRLDVDASVTQLLKPQERAVVLLTILANPGPGR